MRVSGTIGSEPHFTGRVAQTLMSINKLCIVPLIFVCALTHAEAEPRPSASLPAAPQTLEEAMAQQQRAAQLRKLAAHERASIEGNRQRDDQECLRKLLVNACHDSVRNTYIERIRHVRQQEIDANQLERAGKSKQLEIESAARLAAKPNPLENGHSGHSSSMPSVGDLPKPATKAMPLKAKPEAVPRPSAKPYSDAERQARQSTAARQQKQREQEAAERARRAREDAERYDKRAKEHAAKKAARSADAAVKANL